MPIDFIRLMELAVLIIVSIVISLLAIIILPISNYWFWSFIPIDAIIIVLLVRAWNKKALEEELEDRAWGDLESYRTDSGE